jgi:hypothetical protein
MRSLRRRSTAPGVAPGAFISSWGSRGSEWFRPFCASYNIFSPYLALYSEIGLYLSSSVSELCRYFAGTCAFGYQAARIMPSASAHLLAVIGRHRRVVSEEIAV